MVLIRWVTIKTISKKYTVDFFVTRLTSDDENIYKIFSSMKTKWRDDDDDEGGKNVGHKFVCIYFIALYETIFFSYTILFFFCSFVCFSQPLLNNNISIIIA